MAEIRRRVSLGMFLAVAAGFVGILIAAVVAVATGDHGQDSGDDDPR
jgi:hypothetical protein